MQDTIVALDALSKYLVIFQQKPDIFTSFRATGQEQQLNINGNDELKVITYDLKKAEDTVHLQISGSGCVLMQVIDLCVYSLHNGILIVYVLKNQHESRILFSSLMYKSGFIVISCLFSVKKKIGITFILYTHYRFCQVAIRSSQNE